MILDSETKAVELPEDHGDELRLWLRLLTCTTLIEGEVRSRLRERFDVTLPRFDLMAQLDKVPDGMTLSDVSKRMMVSNGNVTGLVERLVESGHVDRRTSETDRRVQVIRLTKLGRAEFRRMAEEHETWIAEIFTDLTPKDVRELMRLLAKTKGSAQKAAQKIDGQGAVTTIDFEAEYNNRARVPDSGELIAGWARDARAFREQGGAPRVISYGAGARNTIDYFAAAGDKGPIVVFIHGGYWQALDASFFSHLSRGLTHHGSSVAMPSYDLCPQVSVADIVAQMRAAVLELAKCGRPLVIVGHSAGGHLAACMLATDWPAIDPALPSKTVIAAYAISGLFDLAPLVPTSINKALRLDDASVRAVSPLFGPVPRHGSLDAVVGAEESSEYFRQSRSIVDTWGRAIPTVYGTVPGANHFTAIATLADPDSPMVLRLKALAALN